MSTKCCGETRGDGWHRGRCSRAGVVERAGKFYCRQHDPEAVALRRAEREAEWDRKWAEQKAARDAAKAAADRQARLAALAPGAIAILDQIARGHNDPRGAASDFLSAHFDDARMALGKGN